MFKHSWKFFYESILCLLRHNFWNCINTITIRLDFCAFMENLKMKKCARCIWYTYAYKISKVKHLLQYTIYKYHFFNDIRKSMNLHKYAQSSNGTRLSVMIRLIKFEANLKMSTEVTINNACIFRWLFANVVKDFSIVIWILRITLRILENIDITC